MRSLTIPKCAFVLSFQPHNRNHQNGLEWFKISIREQQSKEQIRNSYLKNTNATHRQKKITRARVRKIQRSTERKSALMTSASPKFTTFERRSRRRISSPCLDYFLMETKFRQFKPAKTTKSHSKNGDCQCSSNAKRKHKGFWTKMVLVLEN